MSSLLVKIIKKLSTLFRKSQDMNEFVKMVNWGMQKSEGINEIIEIIFAPRVEIHT